jgi:hypothetical protein
MDKADIHWGTPVNGLRLGVAGTAGMAELSLENVGAAPLRVLSHVNAGEIHLDWFTVELRDRGGAERTLHLMAARNKSGRVEVTLAPGQSLQHRVDLQAWAVRAENDGKELAEGDYALRATYQVEPEEGRWSGKLTAGPTTVHVAARPR